MFYAIHKLSLACMFTSICLTTAGLNNEPITTFFGRRNKDGSFVDRADPEFDYYVKKPLRENVEVRGAGSTLRVWPPVASNGQEVTVLWWNITQPKEKDFIAYYCPHNDDPNHYIDLFHVSDVSQSWEKGYGHHTVNVYNMRTSCAFKYFKAESSHLIAKSNLLKFENGGKMPLQRHIAVTGDPTQMRISWNSGKVHSSLMVKYGLTPELGNREMDVTIHYYEAKDMCTSPANTTGFWDPGYTYDVVLKNLLPNTRYYYAVGSKKAMSEVASFVTPLPAGDTTPFKFIVYGDMGTEVFPQGMGTAELVTEEINDNPDVRYILHHGDISYASGFAYTWDKWFDVIEPYASKVPYMVSIGNHEYDFVTGGEKDPSKAKGKGGFRPEWWNGKDESGGECGVPMYKRFHMPDTGHSLWWYSYDYGLVHNVVISTEHDFRPGSPMYKWLVKDLAGVDRKKTPWVIVAGHRAMYTSVDIPSDYRVSKYMQMYFEDVLKENKVDIAFWAHLHSTQRTCKVYKRECRDDGVTHIVVGSGGKSFDSTKFHEKKWSLFEMADWGYSRVSVANATHLHYEWINNRRNQVLDDVWFVKQ